MSMIHQRLYPELNPQAYRHNQRHVSFHGSTNGSYLGHDPGDISHSQDTRLPQYTNEGYNNDSIYY